MDDVEMASSRPTALDGDHLGGRNVEVGGGEECGKERDLERSWKHRQIDVKRVAGLAEDGGGDGTGNQIGYPGPLQGHHEDADEIRVGHEAKRGLVWIRSVPGNRPGSGA